MSVSPAFTVLSALQAEGSSRVALQAAMAREVQTMTAEMKQLLPAGVHEQLLAGGEPGMTELTLQRWLRARKVGAAADPSCIVL